MSGVNCSVLCPPFHRRRVIRSSVNANSMTTQVDDVKYVARNYESCIFLSQVHFIVVLLCMCRSHLFFNIFAFIAVTYPSYWTGIFDTMEHLVTST